MFTFRNLSLALCVIFFITSSNLSAQDNPSLHEIFADSSMRNALLDATVKKQEAPDFLLNSLFQLSVNASLEISKYDFGQFKSVEIEGKKGRERTQKIESITVTTSDFKTTVYYSLFVGNLKVSWCNDGYEPNCVHIFDSNGNGCVQTGDREWGVYSTSIRETDIRSAIKILLETF